MSAVTTLKRLQISPDLWLAYEEMGQSGVPVIFLHGLSSDHQTWKKNIDFLVNDFHCLAPDLPGYGRSSNLDIKNTVDYYSECILAFIEKLGLDKVVMVGHSMGAQVAVKSLLKSPKKVNRLVLIAPAGFEKFSQNEVIWMKRFYRPEIIQQIPFSDFVNNIKSNFYNAQKIENELLTSYERIYQSTNYHDYCRTLCDNVWSMLEDPIFEYLEEIKIPSLVIFGHNDQMIPHRLLHPHSTTQDIAEEASAKIVDCTLKIIDHAGHFVHWEQSAVVNRIILNFLK